MIARTHCLERVSGAWCGEAPAGLPGFRQSGESGEATAAGVLRAEAGRGESNSERTRVLQGFLSGIKLSTDQYTEVRLGKNRLK